MIWGMSRQQKTTGDSSKSPFAKVAECLYRHASSGTYYGLVKQSGKQFRRSLKTNDRQLAMRRLGEYREKIARTSAGTMDRKILFIELAELWQKNFAVGLKASAIRRRGFIIGRLAVEAQEVVHREAES